MSRILSQTFGAVGAVIEKEGKFLLVREEMPGFPDHGKWNQPAGWIEVGEDPMEAVRREVEEETGYAFTPRELLGVYSLVRSDIAKDLGATPHGIKLIFTGTINERDRKALADDSAEARWFTAEEIKAMDRHTLRDIDIKRMVDDYGSGKRYPLDVLRHTDAATNS